MLHWRAGRGCYDSTNSWPKQEELNHLVPGDQNDCGLWIPWPESLDLVQCFQSCFLSQFHLSLRGYGHCHSRNISPSPWWTMVWPQETWKCLYNPLWQSSLTEFWWLTHNQGFLLVLYMMLPYPTDVWSPSIVYHLANDISFCKRCHFNECVRKLSRNLVLNRK